MLTAGKFEMRDVVDRAALEAHPVWAPFKGGEDRKRILGWGVTAERLDEEIDRFAYCGTEPLFPVLELDPLPEIGGMVIAAAFEGTGGCELCGYLLGGGAFGLFTDQSELCFNPSLPEAGGRVAERLAEILRVDWRELFPLRYRCGFRGADGREIEGVVEPFWA